MANFFVGNGDTAQLNVIIRTVNAKSYILPGVTCRDDIQMFSGESANYWVKEKMFPGADQTLKPGGKHVQEAVGLVRKTVNIDKCEPLDFVIPGINYNCVAADTVNAYLVDSTINAANKRNRDYLTVLEGAAVAADKTYNAASDDVYTTILDLRAEFIKKNKADYMVPTALFVSPLVMARLKEKNLVLFKDNSPYGTFLEMEIIEAPDLTCDMIMMNACAMVSAIAYQAVEVFSGAPIGYPGGTAASGEIDYCNVPTEFSAGWEGKPILKIGA